jgi:hypothetical protein
MALFATVGRDQRGRLKRHQHLLLPQWRPRSWLRWSPSSGWTALASLAPFVASASSPGARKSGCDAGKAALYAAIIRVCYLARTWHAGHANGICGTLGHDDVMVSRTLANPNAAGSIAPQHQRRSSQSALSMRPARRPAFRASPSACPASRACGGRGRRLRCVWH